MLGELNKFMHLNYLEKADTVDFCCCYFLYQYPKLLINKDIFKNILKFFFYFFSKYLYRFFFFLSFFPNGINLESEECGLVFHICYLVDELGRLFIILSKHQVLVFEMNIFPPNSLVCKECM